jgi:hypothetical protein
VAFGVVSGLVLIDCLGVQADAAGHPVTLGVVADLVLVDRLGVLVPPVPVAFGVVGVPSAAVVGGRLVLRGLVSAA